MAIYIGGTGSANELDDYEEGTFTPQMMSSSGGAANASYTYQTGKYVKVGNMVHIRFDITWSSWTNINASIIVDNLPFTNQGAQDSGGYGAPQFRDLSGIGADIRIYGNSSYNVHNSNRIYVFKYNSSGTEGPASANSSGRITGETVFYVS